MEEKVIRVAQIIGMAIDGGVESCIMNYYRKIDKSKVQFDFFVETTSKIIVKEKIEAMGGRVVYIPSYKNPFKYVKALKKLFKDGNYDIVHSNMNSLSVFSLYAAKKAGVKVRIAHSHSTSNKKEWLKNIIKGMLRPFSKKYATHYLACSELAGRWLFGKKAFESGKVTVINNAIDLEKFKYDEVVRDRMRSELEIEDKFVVGHIGRFMPQKNQMFLLDVFNELQKIRPNSVLLILGNGPLHHDLIEKTHDLKIYDKVIFAGVHKKPARYYQAMDMFLLPSLYEGLPVVGVEAQVNGLRVITSSTVTKDLNITGNVEYISLDKPAEYWAKVINDYDMNYNRLEAYEKLKGTKFDIQSEAVKLLAYYREMLYFSRKDKK